MVKKEMEDRSQKLWIHPKTKSLMRVPLLSLFHLVVIMVFDTCVCLSALAALHAVKYICETMLVIESRVIDLMGKVSTICIIVAFCLYIVTDTVAHFRRTFIVVRGDKKSENRPLPIREIKERPKHKANSGYVNHNPATTKDEKCQ